MAIKKCLIWLLGQTNHDFLCFYSREDAFKNMDYLCHSLLKSFNAHVISYFIFHFVSLRSGVLESTLCACSQHHCHIWYALQVCPGSDARLFNFDKIEDCRLYNTSILVFVPKLDFLLLNHHCSQGSKIFRCCSGVISCLLNIFVQRPIFQGHQRSLTDTFSSQYNCPCTTDTRIPL